MGLRGPKPGSKNSPMGPRRMAMVVAHIEAAKLVTRLTKHAMGENEMTPTQIQAAKILMDKWISNAPTRISGPDGGDIPIMVRVEFVNGATLLTAGDDG